MRLRSDEDYPIAWCQIHKSGYALLVQQILLPMCDDLRVCSTQTRSYTPSYYIRPQMQLPEQATSRRPSASETWEIQACRFQNAGNPVKPSKRHICQASSFPRHPCFVRNPFWKSYRTFFQQCSISYQSVCVQNFSVLLKFFRISCALLVMKSEYALPLSICTISSPSTSFLTIGSM